MKKKIVYLILTAVIILGISVPCFAASANTGNIGDISSLRSRNRLKYQSAEGSVELYSDDIMFLADKISTIPNRAFDSGIYSHVHVWEYIDINDLTHTKHCEECGSENDITNPHTAAQRESYEISYDGSTYGGARLTCECGYQWIRESSHNYIYTYVDDTKHSVTCALTGTEYCTGFDSYEEEHVFDEATADNDGLHHTLKCSSCGYERVEECDYTDHFEIDEDAAEITWYCQCGNYITEPYTETDISTDPDTDTGASTDTDTDTDSNSDPENANPKISEVTIYVSNNDRTHQVLQGEDVLETAQPCTLTVDPESYDDITGQAVYVCEYCNYSIEDVYEPDQGE